MSAPCCDMHNEHCEPPYDLCCIECTEAAHPRHADGSECTWTVDPTTLHDWTRTPGAEHPRTKGPVTSRRFALVRDVDVTGISGTGVVAEGVQFSDGVAVLRWLQDGVAPEHRARGVRPTTVVFESVAAVEALHGHGGATRVEWTDA